MRVEVSSSRQRSVAALCADECDFSVVKWFLETHSLFLAKASFGSFRRRCLWQMVIDAGFAF